MLGMVKLGWAGFGSVQFGLVRLGYIRIVSIVISVSMLMLVNRAVTVIGLYV
jgi:hypothetical protein